MQNKRLLVALLLILSLATVLLISSCQQEEPAPVGDGKFDYSISVTDPDGAPVKDMLIRIYKGTEQVKMSLTNQEGKASGNLPDGNYTVTVESPYGKAFYYDEATAFISNESPDLSVKIYDTIDSSKGSSNLYFAYEKEPVVAPVVSDGKYRVPLSGGQNFFVFVPSVRGRYEFRIESDTALTLQYNGSPSYVQEPNLASPSDDGQEVFMASSEAICFNIRAFHLGESYESTSKFVVSITAPENTSAYITVGKIADIAPSPQEMPWEELGLSASPNEYAVPNGDCTNVTLTDFDITDKNITIVYNSNDGYYHVGTADGPVLYLRLTSGSQYLGSIQNLCENTLFGGYIYDGDGNFVNKISYHSMMLKYIEAADDTYGVYPLDNNLKEAIQTYGEIQGWWREGSMSFIFSGLGASLNVENAWLFACAYVDGYGTGSAELPLEISSTGKLALLPNVPLYLAVPSGATASYNVIIPDASNICVTVNGITYTSGAALTVSSGDVVTITYVGEDSVYILEYTAAVISASSSAVQSTLVVSPDAIAKLYVIAGGAFEIRFNDPDAKITVSCEGVATTRDGDYLVATFTVDAAATVEITVSSENADNMEIAYSLQLLQ